MSSRALIKPVLIRSGSIATLADAEHALKTIAIAEAAEKVWTRAKDTTKLFAAIKAKLHHQAAYAVWRQNIAVQGRHISELKDEQLPDTDPGAVVVHRWRQRLCAKINANKWEIDGAKLGMVLDDAHKRCVRVCEQQNMGTVRGTEGTGEFERYTPAEYIEKAREVLGAIDLDPATSEHAQKTVQATEYFTAEDDGLQREWHGRVWLNPPYHRELASDFIDKLTIELGEGRVTEAILLTNNSTDTLWFRAAANVCAAICFTMGRIHFEVPHADPVMPTQGQAFFYFGPNIKMFARIFKTIGLCVRPI